MSFPIRFEELLPWFELQGECTVFEVAGQGGTSQIEHDSAWGIDFEWTQNGGLCWLLAGSWDLSIYLEQMGGGEIPELPGSSRTVRFVSTPSYTYNERIQFPPGQVGDGIYRVVVAITLKGPSGNPGPVVGFGDGGMVQFYTSAVPLRAATTARERRPDSIRSRVMA